MKRNEFSAVEVVLSQGDLYDAIDSFLERKKVRVPKGKRSLLYNPAGGGISMLVLSDKKEVSDEQTTDTD